jgi:hypothetical protein
MDGLAEGAPRRQVTLRDRPGSALMAANGQILMAAVTLRRPA